MYLVEGAHEPIIEPTVFEKVREMKGCHQAPKDQRARRTGVGRCAYDERVFLIPQGLKIGRAHV